ncbi:Inositol-pentakisphosphate 2-kinase [Rhizopus azygosporus]|nr:Inositol-pentakisphosphate 2-kinase [Rhizopus azygosporus]
MLLDQFVANDWSYVGEGNANIVVRYMGQDVELKRKVLRVKKKQVYTESAAKFSQQFTDKIIARLLGQEYVLPFEIVHVSRKFLIELASHIEPQRPLCRLEKKINCDSTVAILLEDLTESNSIPTLTFELKPKWGFKPRSSLIRYPKLKQTHCRFCMHSHYRNKHVPDYCPLDLYSRDETRVTKAIEVLTTCKSLTKTLKISSDLCLNMDDIKHVLKEIILKDPILSRIQKLQRQLDELDIEGIFPIYEKHKPIKNIDIEQWVKVIDNFEKGHRADMIQRLYEYVLSMTFKDCSLLVNARHIKDGDRMKHIRLRNGIYIGYDIKVIDTDLKDIEKIPYWYELDQTIVHYAKDTHFNKVCVEQ